MSSWEAVVDRITSFIQECVKKAGARGVVIGVSGGIDSACVAKLSTMALGKDSVLGLIMPEKDVTPPQDVEDAVSFCNGLGIRYKVLEINPLVDAFVSVLGDKPEIAVANLKPRIRMTLLYFHANSERLLVAGTGNRSELMVGYFTKYGDGGVDILPIGDLYKTEVFQLARHIGIPDSLISKKPSARLWKGQTDEEELGISYERIDAVLKAMEEGKTAGIRREDLDIVAEMVERSRHKRELPPVASVRDLV